MKSTDTIEKPIYCKACMKEIKTSPFRLLAEKEPLLCDSCISQIKKKLEIRECFGIKVLFLSEYDDFFKNMLMNYKEFGDVELAPCFLYCFLPILKILFWNYTFLPLPSSQSRVKKRGFSHLVEMLKASKMNYLDVFSQKEELEQKNLSVSSRLGKKKIFLKEDKFMMPQKRNVVLFDDVMTSGSTFQQSLSCLKGLPFQKIKGVILMDNYNHGKIGK